MPMTLQKQQLQSQGKLTFDGAKPNLVKIQMTADPVCNKAHTAAVLDQSVVVNDDGTLQNVLFM